MPKTITPSFPMVCRLCKETVDSHISISASRVYLDEHVRERHLEANAETGD